MNRRKVNASSVLLPIALLTSLVTASCESETPKLDSANTIQTDTITITTAKALRDYDVLKGSDTIDHNPITRWAKERLGIKQVNKWVLTDQNQSMATRIKLALTSGEELPDVLFVKRQDLPEVLFDLAKSGKVMPMKTAYEAYANPRIKEAFRSNPDVWKTVTVDGVAWGLPQIADEQVGTPILWIREDWLERLKLKPPATLEQLEEVLHAFTHDDPDGNGIKDTYGFALSGKHTLNGWMGDASLVFGAFGDQPYQWNRSPDGNLAYGSLHVGVKHALERLNKWYARGYLHPDFSTHDEQGAVSEFMSGRAGVISGPGWMGGWPLHEMPAKGMKVKAIPYPSGPGGKAINKVGSHISYGAYFFRKDFAHMNLVFQYLDHVYSSLSEDPQSDFLHGYGEGYDYLRKDGEIVYDFPGSTAMLSSFFLITPGSVPTALQPRESIQERVLRGQVVTPYEKRMATSSSQLYLEGMVVGHSQVKQAQPNLYYGQLSPESSVKWASIQKLEKETFLKVIYGSAPSSAFDEWLRMWGELGGDQIYREVNDWDRVTEQGKLAERSGTERGVS